MVFKLYIQTIQQDDPCNTYCHNIPIYDQLIQDNGSESLGPTGVSGYE